MLVKHNLKNKIKIKQNRFHIKIHLLQDIVYQYYENIDWKKMMMTKIKKTYVLTLNILKIQLQEYIKKINNPIIYNQKIYQKNNNNKMLLILKNKI